VFARKRTSKTVQLLLELGVDPNIQAITWAHGAARRRAQGPDAGYQMLVDAGAKLDTRDYGMTGNDAGGRLAVIPGSRLTTPTVWCASACNRRSRIPRPAFCEEADDTERHRSAADGPHAGVRLHY